MDTATLENKASHPWRLIFAGLCASLIANGFGRFAYTPLIPAQIEAHWFSPSQTIYFGAAIIAGDLLGALTAGPIGRKIPNVPLLRGALLTSRSPFLPRLPTPQRDSQRLSAIHGRPRSGRPLLPHIRQRHE